jgi:hypothetical protein
LAGEIQIPYRTGVTVYTTIHSRTGTVWSTSGGTGAFETFTSGTWAEYVIATSEQGVTGYYVGDFPAALPAGYYNLDARQQIGGSPAQTDPRAAAGTEQFDGSALFRLSDLATSGQVANIGPLRIARGTMVQNFPFKLVSAADHVTPFTSGTISGQISRDGGAFGALQSGAFTEVGLGWYTLQALTSGDLNANSIALTFTGVRSGGTGSDPRDCSIITQRVSGQ